MMKITKTSPLSALLFLSGSASALAQPDGSVLEDQLPPPPKASRLGLQLEAATELPLFVGARLQLRLPARLHLGGGVGALPGGLLDMSSGVVTSVADLDEATSALIAQGLDDGWMGKAYLGWSPFVGEAFYLQVGYAYIGVDGGLSAADLGLLGVDLPSLGVSGNATFNAAMHAGEVELGFRWAVDDVRIRLSIGLTAILAAESTVNLDTAGLSAPQIAALEGETGALIDDGLTRYGFIPTVGLGVGYDLGF